MGIQDREYMAHGCDGGYLDDYQHDYQPEHSSKIRSSVSLPKKWSCRGLFGYLVAEFATVAMVTGVVVSIWFSLPLLKEHFQLPFYSEMAVEGLILACGAAGAYLITLGRDSFFWFVPVGIVAGLVGAVALISLFASGLAYLGIDTVSVVYWHRDLGANQQFHPSLLDCLRQVIPRWYLVLWLVISLVSCAWVAEEKSAFPLAISASVLAAICGMLLFHGG
ncbi:hypothetical protein N9Y42_02930 [Mariniblastus sp.]|nr:hypothetical protein [Mariniblastus sp.]